MLWCKEQACFLHMGDCQQKYINLIVCLLYELAYISQMTRSLLSTANNKASLVGTSHIALKMYCQNRAKPACKQVMPMRWFEQEWTSRK